MVSSENEALLTGRCERPSWTTPTFSSPRTSAKCPNSAVFPESESRPGQYGVRGGGSSPRWAPGGVSLPSSSGSWGSALPGSLGPFLAAAKPRYRTVRKLGSELCSKPLLSRVGVHTSHSWAVVSPTVSRIGVSQLLLDELKTCS